VGSLSSVFRSWKRHVTSEVHRQPSMQWSNGGAPVLATTNFYIVGDLAGATACYITAHGGLSDGDYYFDNTAFRVPAGVTINFYQPHGYTLGFHTGALRNNAPIAHGGTDDQSYGAGADCPNYMLTKDQGMHAAGDMDTARRFDMTYAAMQEIVEEQGIVIVSVRNRWFHAGVTLKSAVSEVTSAAPGITTFNCLFCRVTDDSGDDRWNAVGGMWDQG
jgi:hypothetical protein